MGGAHAIQWFFACVSVIGFFFALLFLPETHGKKLSEIEAYFSQNNKSQKKSSKNQPANRKTNGSVANNRKPKQQPTLETVKESEKMIKDAVKKDTEMV